MQTTLVVQVGNSDDKLAQKEWAEFVGEVEFFLNTVALEKHFFGTSDGWRSWQNACWVLTVFVSQLPHARDRLSAIGRKYRQDSVAVTEGRTEFV